MKKSLFPLLLLTALCIYSCQKDPAIKFPPDVVTDVHVIDTITSSEDSIQLIGSATDKDGDVVAYLWSLVSGPSVPEIITPGLPHTYISSVVPGTYIFQLMATDNEGFTGVAMDTVQVFLKQKTLHELVLQPTNNDEEVIIFGNNTGFDQTNNGTVELCAGEWTYSGVPSTFKSLFKFRLDSLPAGATIQNAALSLYSNPTPLNGNGVDANYGSNNTMLIQRVTTPWVGADVTYTNQPSATTQDQVVIPSTNQSMLDLINVDVSTLVNTMYNTGNNGFLIRLQTTQYYNDRDFCSSRWSDPTKHPKLVIHYYL